MLRDLRETIVAVRSLLRDRFMFSAERDHKLTEFEKVMILLQVIPVKPRDLIILTVRVVVAEPRIAKLISGQHHRNTAAAHKH